MPIVARPRTAQVAAMRVERLLGVEEVIFVSTRLVVRRGLGPWSVALALRRECNLDETNWSPIQERTSVRFGLNGVDGSPGKWRRFSGRPASRAALPAIA